MNTLAGLLLAGLIGAAQAANYLPLPGGVFRSALPPNGQSTVKVAPFSLRDRPVSNAEYLAFVRTAPQWQRGQSPALFAGANYLHDWRGPADLGGLNPQAPVTWVSWYAARAYCNTEGATLPSWYQWEFAAAADASRRDARDDPAWRQRILDWYAVPASANLPAVGGDIDIYGVADMHQLIFEWVEDYNGLFVTADSRGQGEVKTLETCGAAALSLGDKDNYAILMRIAVLAALDGRDTLGSMGFRCVRPLSP